MHNRTQHSTIHFIHKYTYMYIKWKISPSSVRNIPHDDCEEFLEKAAYETSWDLIGALLARHWNVDFLENASRSEISGRVLLNLASVPWPLGGQHKIEEGRKTQELFARWRQYNGHKKHEQQTPRTHWATSTAPWALAGNEPNSLMPNGACYCVCLKPTPPAK